MIVQKKLFRSQIKKIFVSVIHGCVTNYTGPDRGQGKSSTEDVHAQGQALQTVWTIYTNKMSDNEVSWPLVPISELYEKG